MGVSGIVISGKHGGHTRLSVSHCQPLGHGYLMWNTYGEGDVFE